MAQIIPQKFIALLGGSFNPAHEGHLHISIEARKYLGTGNIGGIWWLVSPQNPLKSSAETAEFSQRIAAAEKITANHRFIHVSDIENKLKTRYTIATLKKIRRRFPRTKFIWLMGADNLATIHNWQQWAAIFSLVPIMVLDRSPFSHSALRKKAALRFARYRKNPRDLLKEKLPTLPSWSYVHMRLHPASSSAIRRKEKVN